MGCKEWGGGGCVEFARNVKDLKIYTAVKLRLHDFLCLFCFQFLEKRFTLALEHNVAEYFIQIFKKIKWYSNALYCS